MISLGKVTCMMLAFQPRITDGLPTERALQSWRFLLRAIFCFVILVVRAAETVSAGDEGPTAERLEFWAGRDVIQVFGNVFAIEDKADVATEYYWVLEESAVGKVVELIDGNLVRAEFSSDTGWQRVAVPPPETKVSFNFDYDNYGYLEGVTKTVVTTRGIRVGPREWGRVVDEAGGRRLVEFPIENLGLPRPRRGQRVVRGPDWQAGHADGGAAPIGPVPPGSEMTGEVISEPDSDRYVKVRWDKTGRECFYRFDRRRYYDIELYE
jgi:hypothetical protein